MSEQLKVYGIPELAKQSGMSAGTLRQLCKSGKLPYLALGNRWLIKLSDFEKLFVKEGDTIDRTEKNS